MAHHVHSLNNSPAKQKYSFSKQERFVYKKPLTQIFYLPKIEKDNRSALMGYGQRSLGNINQKMYENTPHGYSIPSTISANKGYSFMGGGRHELGGPLQRVKYQKEYPGPDKYGLPSSLDRRGPILGSRLADFSLKHLTGLPGPGAYSIPSTIEGADEDHKKIYDSRFSNRGTIKITELSNSTQLIANKPSKMSVPGPGAYDIQKYGMNNPQSVTGRHQTIKFPRQKRGSLAKRDAEKEPGPAAYKLYSQFD